MTGVAWPSLLSRQAKRAPPLLHMLAPAVGGLEHATPIRCGLHDQLHWQGCRSVRAIHD
jgi:hypothetical protein